MSQREVDFRERLSYPSAHDPIRRVATEAAYVTFPAWIALTVANAIVPPLEAVGVLSDPIVRHMLLSTWMGLAGGMTLSVSVSESFSNTEIRNRVPFGELLTVSTVATKYAAAKHYFPEQLGNQQYYGELHIRGRGNNQSATPKETLRHGIAGLALLAKACEQEDPRLKGLDYFYGQSPFISKKLAQFGFIFPGNPDYEQFRTPDVRGYYKQIFRGIMDQLQKPKQAPKLSARTRITGIALISRAELIGHREFLESYSFIGQAKAASFY